MYSKVFIIHIHVFSLFSSSFPIKVITKYWAEFPILYNRSLLVIYFKYKSVCIWQPQISTSFVYWWIIFNLWIYHILFIINDGISHFCYCNLLLRFLLFCSWYTAAMSIVPWLYMFFCGCVSLFLLGIQVELLSHMATHSIFLLRKFHGERSLVATVQKVTQCWTRLSTHTQHTAW